MYRFMISVVLGLLLLSACGAGQPEAVQPTKPAPTVQVQPGQVAGPLLEIDLTGGHCLAGQCSRHILFDNNGHLVIKEGSGAIVEADLQQAELEQLRSQIAAADFATIQATPFTDICPIAYDGQEQTFHFSTAQGIVSLASCKV